jgi:DNA modification methylase
MSSQIVTGDALELIPTLDDASVRLVVTSPPYPGQYGCRLESPEWLRWTAKWLKALQPKLTPGGVIVLVVQFKRTERGWYDHLVFKLGDPSWTDYNLLDMYVYGKQNPPPNGALTFCDPPGWEHIFVLTNAARPEDVAFYPVRAPYAAKSLRRDGTLYSNMSRRRTPPHPDGARQTTLLMMSKSADQNRPSAKGISFPRALPERFIRQYTRPGEVVLDPFCGVGTTVRIAHELGRQGIGFEVDPAEADRARVWLAEPVRPEPSRAGSLFTRDGCDPLQPVGEA